MNKKDPAAVSLGSRKSSRKAATSRENGINWDKPHFRKVAHFERIYPYSPLINNEWRDKFPVGKTPTGKVATYNPDYFCETTGYYIEVATSLPNISEQGWKWAKVIAAGVNLKVYWWEGNEITNQFLPENTKPKNTDAAALASIKTKKRAVAARQNGASSARPKRKAA